MTKDEFSLLLNKWFRFRTVVIYRDHDATEVPHKLNKWIEGFAKTLKAAITKFGKNKPQRHT